MSNVLQERNISLDLVVETIVADIFKTMNYNFKEISFKEYCNVISTIDSVLEDKMKLNLTVKNAKTFYINSDHSYNDVCRDVLFIITQKSLFDKESRLIKMQQYLDIQERLNVWKQKYLSREKALEKYNTTESTVVAKEEEKIDPNVDRTIANISDKLSSIIEKNDNNINCILVHAVKLGLLETAESINILKEENKKLKDEIEMLKKGNFNKNMKFSDSQIRSIKNMNRYGIDIKRIAMEYNCSINDIKNIIEE